MPDPAPSFWKMLWSAFCALFGVQSEKNRLRDFQSRHAGAYIAAGLIVTLLFILLVLGLVKLSLRLL